MQTKKRKVFISIEAMGDKADMKYSGTNRELIDCVYTMLSNDKQLAAIICTATKDFIETLKSEPKEWEELTKRISAINVQTINQENHGKK